MIEMIELPHDGVIRETGLAKLFDLGDCEAWIPKSIIDDEDDELVTVPEWWAIKEGLV